jgi:hypothetical protein
MAVQKNGPRHRVAVPSVAAAKLHYDIQEGNHLENDSCLPRYVPEILIGIIRSRNRGCAIGVVIIVLQNGRYVLCMVQIYKHCNSSAYNRM